MRSQLFFAWLSVTLAGYILRSEKSGHNCVGTELISSPECASNAVCVGLAKAECDAMSTCTGFSVVRAGKTWPPMRYMISKSCPAPQSDGNWDFHEKATAPQPVFLSFRSGGKCGTAEALPAADSLAGNGHQLTACWAACGSKDACNFAAVNAAGACHMFRSCNIDEGTGWTVYQKSSNFMLVDEKNSWDDAQATCAAAGHELAKIDSATIHSELKDFMTVRHPKDLQARYAIGGMYSVSMSTWVWSDLTSLGYTNWDTNQASEGANDPKMCVAVDFNPDLKWHSCNTLYNYFKAVCRIKNPATCTDGLQNQGETGVDCGGLCSACATCTDGLQNQGETGVDCGGPCSSCATCTDGLQNQGETGVDCGGPCSACETCTDGLQNQGETGVDCGGPCSACVCGTPPVDKIFALGKAAESPCATDCSDDCFIERCEAGKFMVADQSTCVDTGCPTGEYEKETGICLQCTKQEMCYETDSSKPCVSDTEDGVKDKLWCKSPLYGYDFITDEGKPQHIGTTLRSILAENKSLQAEIDALKSSCAKSEDIAAQCLLE